MKRTLISFISFLFVCRCGHELCLWEKRLFVLGGGTTFFSACGFKDLPTFDIEERRWFYTRTMADQHASIDNVGDDNDDLNIIIAVRVVMDILKREGFIEVSR